MRKLSPGGRGRGGGGFSGGAGTFRRQKCLSLEGWDQAVSRRTGRNVEECPAGPDGSPSGSPRPHRGPSPLSPLMQVLLWPGPRGLCSGGSRALSRDALAEEEPRGGPEAQELLGSAC